MQKRILIPALSLKRLMKKPGKSLSLFARFFSYLGKSCFSLAFTKDAVAERELFSCERKERKWENEFRRSSPEIFNGAYRGLLCMKMGELQIWTKSLNEAIVCLKWHTIKIVVFFLSALPHFWREHGKSPSEKFIKVKTFMIVSDLEIVGQRH